MSPLDICHFCRD